MIADKDIDRTTHQQHTRHLSGEGLQELTVRSYVTIRDWLREDRQRSAAEPNQQRGLYQLIQDLAFDAGVSALYGKIDKTDLKKQFDDFDKDFPLLVGQAPKFLLGNSAEALSQLIKRFSTWNEKEDESSIVAARRQMFKQSCTLDDVGSCQFSLLWAAVANTLVAAFWTVAYLLKHTDALAAVKAELDTYLPYVPLDDGDSAPWTREQCAQLKLCSSAMNEALRLATGSMVLRTAVEDTEITMHDGRIVGIRKGTSVALFPALTHFDDRVFKNPLEYVVDRFVSRDAFELEGTRLPSAAMFFGAGVSMCPGRFWAMNEVMMMVALLLQHCDLSATDAPLPELDYSRVGLGVFPPVSELLVNFKYRE